MEWVVLLITSWWNRAISVLIYALYRARFGTDGRTDELYQKFVSRIENK
jgi:hypothetical protein